MLGAAFLAPKVMMAVFLGLAPHALRKKKLATTGFTSPESYLQFWNGFIPPPPCFGCNCGALRARIFLCIPKNDKILQCFQGYMGCGGCLGILRPTPVPSQALAGARRWQLIFQPSSPPFISKFFQRIRLVRVPANVLYNCFCPCFYSGLEEVHGLSATCAGRSAAHEVIHKPLFSTPTPEWLADCCLGTAGGTGGVFIWAKCELAKIFCAIKSVDFVCFQALFGLLSYFNPVGSLWAPRGRSNWLVLKNWWLIF